VTQVRGGARLWILAGAALVHALLFVVVFRTIYKTNFSGTGLYYDVASRVLHGELPNRDFPFGYPPLSIAFFILLSCVLSRLLDVKSGGFSELDERWWIIWERGELWNLLRFTALLIGVGVIMGLFVNVNKSTPCRIVRANELPA